MQYGALLEAAADATREVKWNVSPAMLWYMYGTMVVALASFGWGTWRRVRIWRLGMPEPRWDRPGERLRRLAVDALGQASLFRERLPGIMHALVFFAFLVLFVATAVVMIHHDLGVPIMRGQFYLYFQSLATNVFGVLAMVGIGIAAWRRYISRTSRLERGRRFDAALLAVLFLLLATGFLMSGVRIAATADPWGAWRPAAWLVGRLAALAIEPEDLLRLHASAWVLHVTLWHALLAVAPFTKMFHVFSSPLNIYCADLRAPGTLPPLDFDNAESLTTLGVRTPFDLTRKQLLDLDACTECGRCEAVCPAWAEGKPLSPKRVILDLRDHVHASGPDLVAAAKALQRQGEGAFRSLVERLPVLAGEIIRPETLWACTTCRACEEACPVAIQHVRLIIGLRQNLAMEQAELPAGLTESMASLEARQHPFRGAIAERTAWYRDAAVYADTKNGREV